MHLLSQSPGSGVASGLGDVNQTFQSRWPCSNADAMPMKPGTLSSTTMLSHVGGSIQSGHGFGRWSERSTTTPPKQKKSNSGLGTLFSDSRMRKQSWSEKSSLCRSKRPRHVYS